MTRGTGLLRSSLLAALALLAACSQSAPDLPPLEEAKAMLARGDGYGAELELRGLLESGTPAEELAAYLGEAELRQGKPTEARSWLGKGEFSEETRGRGFHMLGRLEMEEGNLPAAGSAFDRALQVNDRDAELWADIGRLRYRGGEQVQAVEASKFAVELGPENPAALLLRAQLVRDAKGLDAAIPWFERGLRAAPDNPDLLAEYAATLGELGRARDMLAAVRQLALVAPRDPRIFFLQAVLAARAGNHQLARSLLLRSGDIERESPAAMLVSGIIDLENGNYGTATQTFDRLSQMQPDNRQMHPLLARAMYLDGNYTELITRFSELAQRPSASRYLVQLVGRAHEALGERDKAAPFLDLAAAPNPNSLIAMQGAIQLDVARQRGTRSGSDTLSLVRNLIVVGQRQEAMRQAEAFQNQHAGSADALVLAGDAALAAGSLGKALKHYEASGEVRLPWSLARKMVAIHRVQGRGDDASRLLERSLAGDPANAEAATLVAQSAFDSGQFERAAVFLDHAIANGATRDPWVLAMRAQVALRLDDNAMGEQYARRAFAIQPTNPSALQVLALALEATDSNTSQVAALREKAARIEGREQLARR